MTLPNAIQARLHPNAIGHVARMFTATVADVLGELLQNARRAGASRVSVQVSGSDQATYVRVTDNGSGIQDPHVLLSFGENGWDPGLTRREDAAGMGFAALSQFDSTVVSQTTGNPAWQVDLTPAHFAGEKSAPLTKPVHGLGRGHGTRVTFGCRIDRDTVARHVHEAARHYPLPVTLTVDRPTGPPRQPVKQEGFLDDCLYTTRLHGIDAGVRHVTFTTTNEPTINFFGHKVHVRLPSIRSLDGRIWAPRLDVKDCSDLKLTLPARREVVENEFFDDLKDRLLTVLYEAVAASDAPYMSCSDYAEAQARGVDLPVPPARLETWTPKVARGAVSPYPRSEVKDLPEGAFLVDDHDTPAEDLTVWRALEEAGLLNRAFSYDGRLTSYPWYQALPRLAGWDIRVDGTPVRDLNYPQMLRRRGLKMPRPETLDVRLVFHQPDGIDTEVETGLLYALFGEPSEWLTCNSAWFLVKGGDVDVGFLAELLECAFFDSNEDSDQDAFETRQFQFRTEANQAACELLLGADAAVYAKIEAVLRQSLPELFFKGRNLTIHVEDGKVYLERKPPAEEPKAPLA